MKFMNLLRAGLAASLFLGAAGAASAAVVELTFLGGQYNGDKGAKLYDTSTDRGTLTCSNTCVGLNAIVVGGTENFPDYNDATEMGGFTGADFSDLFRSPNSDTATEALFVKTATGIDYGSQPQLTSWTGSKEDATFTSTALYVFFKIGKNPDVTIVKNTTGGAITYNWKTTDGEGSGISHFAEFGSVCEPNDPTCDDGDLNQVPVPASLPLLAGGLALAGFVARRKSRKA